MCICSLSGRLSGFLSRHCPECARLWLTWLSALVSGVESWCM